MNPCFMLRKCLSKNDEADGVEVNLSCPVNSACCAGGSVVNNIDETSDDEDESNAQRLEQKCEKLEVHYEGGKHSKAIKGDLLQSESSSKSRFDKCFSHCGETAEENSEGMALEAAHVYTSSKCIETLSNS